MTRHLFILIAALAFTGSTALASTDDRPAGTSDDMLATQSAVTPTGDFVKKRYSVKGQWEIVTLDGQPVIRFTDKFKTKNGPDLKVFLSPHPIDTVTGKTAEEGAVNIGVLKSNKGQQTYALPEGINLSDYKSVLVHCEAYSVLWGGFDIPK